MELNFRTDRCLCYPCYLYGFKLEVIKKCQCLLELRSCFVTDRKEKVLTYDTNQVSSNSHKHAARCRPVHRQPQLCRSQGIVHLTHRSKTPGHRQRSRDLDQPGD